MAFIRVTTDERVLTGAEKATVLFMAVSEAAGKDVARYLTADELMTLQNTVKHLRFGRKEEIRVLQELAEYGMKKGIWKEVPDEKDKSESAEENMKRQVEDIKDVAEQDPEEVAKLIATWLGNGEF